MMKRAAIVVLACAAGLAEAGQKQKVMYKDSACTERAPADIQSGACKNIGAQLSMIYQDKPAGTHDRFDKYGMYPCDTCLRPVGDTSTSQKYLCSGDEWWVDFYNMSNDCGGTADSMDSKRKLSTDYPCQASTYKPGYYEKTICEASTGAAAPAFAFPAGALVMAALATLL